MIERWHIIVLCLAFIVVWMLGKKLFRKPDVEETKKAPGLSDAKVESWFSAAQERAAFAEEQTRELRAASWGGLSEPQQLSLAEDFLAATFGAETPETYSSEEKLRIGCMCVMAGDRTPAKSP